MSTMLTDLAIKTTLNLSSLSLILKLKISCCHQSRQHALTVGKVETALWVEQKQLLKKITESLKLNAETAVLDL